MTISEQLVDLAYGSSYSMSYKIVNSEEEDEDVDESTADKFIGKIYYLLRDIDTGRTDTCEETTAQLHLYGKFNMQNSGYEVIELGDDIDTISGGWPVDDVLDTDMHGPVRIAVDEQGTYELMFNPD